ncbi:MAG: AAA family ATPase, partial [Planctomycetota bacterium]|nr:AAA family ATPase [Planctomycetota bacterium]
GKPNVGFEEVRTVAPSALAHRLILDYTAKLEGVDGRQVVREILDSVPDLARDIPEGMTEVPA